MLKYYINLIAIFILILLCSNSTISIAKKKDKYEENDRTVDAYLTSAGIIIKKKLIYMTFGSESFQKERLLLTIDIENPEKPKLLNRILLTGFPQKLVISREKLYLVNGSKLLIFDITEKTKPSLITSFPINSNPLYGPQGIDVKGNFAFLACRKGGITVVDISNLEQPKIIDILKTSGLAVDVTIKGNYLYVANDTRGMLIVDIKNPQKLRTIGQFKSKNGTTSCIVLEGKYAFLTEGFHMLKIIDISKASKPVIVSSYKNRGTLCFFGSYSYDIACKTFLDGKTKKKLVCLADGESGVQIIDVTCIQKPKSLVALMDNMGLGSPYKINALAIKGNNIFCNDAKYGLRVLKINDHAKLTFLGKGIKIH